MFRYLLSILSLLIISPCVANIASSEYVNEMRDNVQAKIDKKADNANYTQNMVLQTDNSGNVIATTVGTDLFANGSIETIHLADGAVTNADLAGMIDITKLNLGTLPTSGKHMMIWNAETQKYVFERYAEGIVLPDGYTQLEYIEGTGTQYIDTGYVLESDNVVFEWTAKDTQESGNFSLFGSEVDTNPKYTGILHGNKTYRSLWIGASTSRSVGYYSNDNEFHSWVLDIKDTGMVTLSKDTITVGSSSWSMPLQKIKSIGLFYNHGRNQITKAMFKSFTIIDNGNMKVNLIPAKNSSGVIGMYDTVTKTFFTNAGTGNFIAGPEIE